MNKFPFKLGSIEATEIVNIACDSWKKTLADKWGSDLLLNHYTLVSEDFYKEMRQACTEPQHKLFDQIFGKDIDFNILNDKDVFYVRYSNGEHLFKGNAFNIEANIYTITNQYSLKIKLNNLKAQELRLATEKERKLYYLVYPQWSIKDAKDGEPVWCKDKEEYWHFRYADGKGRVYVNQYKSGHTVTYNSYMKFDPNHLPVNPN